MGCFGSTIPPEGCCWKNHPLVKVAVGQKTSGHAIHSCNGCQCNIKPGQHVRRCRQCDFDLCEFCYSKSQTKKALLKHVPGTLPPAGCCWKNHKLLQHTVGVTTRYDIHTCETCRGKIRMRQIVWRCDGDDFDLCETCYMKSKNVTIQNAQDEAHTQEEASKWQCASCTYENKPGNPKCHMCNASRPVVSSQDVQPRIDVTQSSSEPPIEPPPPYQSGADSSQQSQPKPAHNSPANAHAGVPVSPVNVGQPNYPAHNSPANAHAGVPVSPVNVVHNNTHWMCVSCQTSNKDARRFCGGCGQVNPLQWQCFVTDCGTKNESKYEFCGGCGAHKATKMPSPDAPPIEDNKEAMEELSKYDLAIDKLKRYGANDQQAQKYVKYWEKMKGAAKATYHDENGNLNKGKIMRHAMKAFRLANGLPPGGQDDSEINDCAYEAFGGYDAYYAMFLV